MAGDYWWGWGVVLDRFIKVLQAFKILRVFKVSRHFAGTRILVSTFQQSYRALRAPLVFLFVSVVIFSSLMYFLESGNWNNEAGTYLWEDNSSPMFTSILDTAYVKSCCLPLLLFHCIVAHITVPCRRVDGWLWLSCSLEVPAVTLCV